MNKHTITMTDESLAQFLDEQTDELIDLRQENTDLKMAINALIRENLELKSRLVLSEHLRGLVRDAIDIEGTDGK